MEVEVPSKTTTTNQLDKRAAGLNLRRQSIQNENGSRGRG